MIDVKSFLSFTLDDVEEYAQSLNCPERLGVGPSIVLPNGDVYDLTSVNLDGDATHFTFFHLIFDSLAQDLRDEYPDDEDIDYEIYELDDDRRIMDYVESDLGIVTLNEGRTYVEPRAKLVALKKPTDAQYEVIEEYLDEVQKYKSAVYCFLTDKSNFASYRFDENTTDEIIEKIKRTFAFGRVFEGVSNKKTLYRDGQVDDWSNGLFFADDLRYYDYNDNFDAEDTRAYEVDFSNAKIFDPMKEWDLYVNTWSDIRQTKEFFDEKDFHYYEYLDDVDYDEADAYHEVVTDTDALASYAKEHNYDAVVFRDIHSDGGRGPAFNEYCIFNKDIVKSKTITESSKESKRDKAGREYNIWTECTGGYSGQSDYMKIAYVGDDWMDEHDRIIRENILGYLQYAVADDEEDTAYIQMIEVKESERRKGIATALVDSLKKEYKEINWGYTTNDGTKFYNSYNKINESRDTEDRLKQVHHFKHLQEYVETNEFKLGTAGYIKEDGSLIILDEYHGEDKELQKIGYPEFSNTHAEEDTCVRIFNEPNEIQYKKLEEIIDTYLDVEDYCKVEIWKNNKPDFYKIFTLHEGACDYVWEQETGMNGNWTGYKLVRMIKNYFHLNEKIVKKGTKWQVQSEKGRNMGTYDTKAEAEKRLKQVHYFKHVNEDKEDYQKKFDERTHAHIDRVNKYAKKINKEYPHHDEDKFNELYAGYSLMSKNKEDITKEEQAMIDDATFKHVINNEHHCEHWVDPKDIEGFSRNNPTPRGCLDCSKMPESALEEMCCDWCAMSEEFNNTPFEWYEKNKDTRWHFNEEQDKFILDTLHKLWDTEKITEDLQETDNEGHVLSKEQIEFFKNSKVRNKKGELVVCYHSTKYEFDTFNRDLAKVGLFGDGMYFSTSSENIFSHGDKYKVVYLNLENPVILHHNDASLDADVISTILVDTTGGFDSALYDSMYHPFGDWYLVEMYYEKVTGEHKRFYELAEMSGYDGIIVLSDEDIENRRTEIEVFLPNAIKSVDNKNPTNSNNINEGSSGVPNKQKYQNKKLKKNIVKIAKECGFNGIIDTKELSVHHLSDVYENGLKDNSYKNIWFIKSEDWKDRELLHKLLHYMNRNDVSYQELLDKLEEIKLYQYDDVNNKFVEKTLSTFRESLTEAKADTERFLKWISDGYKSMKYSDWASGVYAKEAVNVFNKYKNSLKGEQRDIYAWMKKPFSDFASLISSLKKKDDEKSEVARKEDEGSELVYENDDWLVYEITNYEASVKYGKGTKWCISGSKRWENGKNGREHWDGYHESGIIFYFFINRKNGRKYALAIYPDMEHYEIFNDADIAISYIPDAPFVKQVASLIDGKEHEPWYAEVNPKHEIQTLIAEGKVDFDFIKQYLNDSAYNYREGTLILYNDVDDFVKDLDWSIPDEYLEWEAVTDGKMSVEQYKKLTGYDYAEGWVGDVPQISNWDELKNWEKGKEAALDKSNFDSGFYLIANEDDGEELWSYHKDFPDALLEFSRYSPDILDEITQRIFTDLERGSITVNDVFNAFDLSEDTKDNLKQMYESLSHSSSVHAIINEKTGTKMSKKELRKQIDALSESELNERIAQLESDAKKLFEAKSEPNPNDAFLLSYAKMVKVRDYACESLKEEKESVDSIVLDDEYLSFDEFLDRAEVIVVDDAKTFDINEYEANLMSEIEEELCEEQDVDIKSAFTKYRLDDERLKKVIEKLSKSEFNIVDYWKTKQFMKKNGLTKEDLSFVLRNLKDEDYKTNSISKDDKHNEAMIFVKDSSVGNLGPFSLYIKLDYDSVEENPVIVISFHQRKGSKKKTDSESIVSGLEEDIEKHDELNQKLFDGDELRQDVKDKVVEIANAFVDELKNDGIKFNLKDIVLIGSNVNYNYTKDSDLDIHLIADSDGLECPDELYPLLYSAYRSIFNKNYDITIKGIPAEIYVEMDEPQGVSNGIYSIENGWVKKPVQTDIPDIDREKLDDELSKWEDKYFELRDRIEYALASTEHPLDESLIRESALDESAKTDFIVKFGEDTAKNFEKAKQRLLNKGLSVDYGQYLKYDKKQLDDLLLSLYDDKKDAQKKRVMSGKTREVRGKYNFLGEKNGYLVYEPLDYVASMDLGINTGWCTTGRYLHAGHPEYTPSAKDAKNHWNDYTKEGVRFFYFLDSSTFYGEYALALYPRTMDVNEFVSDDEYLESTNFELFNQKDNLDYSALNSLPIDLINAKLVIKTREAVDGLVLSDDGTEIVGASKSLTSITVPDSVTSIGRYAFYNCHSLVSIIIPNSVTSIGEEAFRNCESLKSIAIPNSITKIENGVFYGCESLKSVKIPDSVTSIDEYAFFDCTSLKSITIPDSVTSIGRYALWGSESLTVHTNNEYVIQYCEEDDTKYVRDAHESLKEEYVDEDKEIFTTESPYEVANMLRSSEKALRILYDRKLKRFFVCDADELIHREMVDAAWERGYYAQLAQSGVLRGKWELDSYLDDYGGHVIYYIYAPLDKVADTYGSEVNEDGYEGKYVYDFGVVTTRSDDKYKSSPLGKALGKYEHHYVQDGWIDDYTPKIIEVA